MDTELFAYIKDEFENIPLIGSEELFMPLSFNGAILNLINDPTSQVSYWAERLECNEPVNDLHKKGDLLIGFIALKGDAELLLNIGPISHKHNLSAGKLEFAYYNEPVPIATIMTDFTSMTALSGKVFAIFALLDLIPRRNMIATYGGKNVDHKINPGLYDGIHFLHEGRVQKF